MMRDMYASARQSLDEAFGADAAAVRLGSTKSGREATLVGMPTHELTAAQQAQISEANRTKFTPSYTDLLKQDWPRFATGKSDTYLRGRELAWENHVASHEIGQMPCAHVTEDAAEIFLNTLVLGMDGRNKLLQTFKRLSRRAIKAGHISYCPFDDVQLRRIRTTEEEKIKSFSPDEYKLILEHARDDDALEYFGFSGGAGPRPGEAKNITWSDVDIDGETITFRYGGGSDGATKTGKPSTVPLLPEAKQWLQRRVDRLHGGTQPSEGLIFGWKKTRSCVGGTMTWV